MKKISTWIITGSFWFLYPFSAFAVESNLQNPLGKGATIEIVVGRIIHAFLGLSGVIALLMFVWGGFQWLMSRGDATKVKNGRDTMIWASLGLVVIFTSYMLVNAVVDALTTGSVLEAPPTP